MTATAGTRANRVKLPLEVYRAVRGAVSERFVVGCRFLAEECIPGGNTAEDAAWFGAEFARAGMDYLSLSRGGKFEDAKQPRVGWARYPYTGPSGYECMPTVRSDERGPFGRNRDATRAVRDGGARRGVRDAGRPVGRHLDLRAGGGAARAGAADIIASARQSLADPDWFRKLRLGLGQRGAALRLHQLLRGPRPGAQAGDLQALGPPRRWRATIRRAPPTAAAGWSPRRGSRPPGESRDRGGGARRPLSRHPAQARRPGPPGDGLRAEPGRGHVRLRRGVLRRDPRERGRGRSRDQPGDGRRRGALGGHRDPLPRHRHAVDRASLLGRGAEDPAGAARPAGAGARGRGAVAAGDPGPLRLRASRRRPDRRRRRRRQPDPRPAGGPVPAPPRLAPQPLRLARHHPPVPRVHLLLQAVAGRALAHPCLSVRARPLDLHRRGEGGDLEGERARRGRRAGHGRLPGAAVRGGAAGPPAPGQPLHLAPLPHRPERALALGQRRAPGRRRAYGALLGGLGHQAGDGGRDRAGGGAQGRRRRSPPRSPATRPAGGPRWRASSARPRRASSGSSRRSATTTPSRSSSPSTCSPAASASPTRT